MTNEPGMSLRVGDCLDVMPTLEPESVSSLVTDPPYGLGFMGKDWDSPGGTGDFPMRRSDSINTVNTGVSRQGGRQRSCVDFAKRQARDARTYQEWVERWAVEALRLLKPGAHAVVFGGTRTYHRLTSGLEDAGFEIRDCLVWLYGEGFPKSRNQDGKWKGWGTALKPGHEPIVLARKPPVGTVAANVAQYGTAALNIDGCRIEGQPETTRFDPAKHSHEGWRMDATGAETAEAASPSGRWPANVVLDEEATAMLDAQSGHLESGNAGKEGHHRNQPPREKGGIYGGGKGLWKSPGPAGALYGDAGGASRFFYCAKADQAERHAGLKVPSLFAQDAPERNTHPTVKPVDLMRWLCRLITPPGGLILDPFMGSGSTGIAAGLEGCSFLGIEREPEYFVLAEARISHWLTSSVVAE